MCIPVCGTFLCTPSLALIVHNGSAKYPVICSPAIFDMADVFGFGAVATGVRRVGGPEYETFIGKLPSIQAGEDLDDPFKSYP